MPTNEERSKLFFDVKGWVESETIYFKEYLEHIAKVEEATANAKEDALAEPFQEALARLKKGLEEGREKLKSIAKHDLEKIQRANASWLEEPQKEKS